MITLTTRTWDATSTYMYIKLKAETSFNTALITWLSYIVQCRFLRPLTLLLKSLKSARCQNKRPKFSLCNVISTPFGYINAVQNFSLEWWHTASLKAKQTIKNMGIVGWNKRNTNILELQGKLDIYNFILNNVQLLPCPSSFFTCSRLL